MRSFVRFAPLAAAALLLLTATGCDSNDGGDFDVRRYVGTYVGTAKGSFTFFGEVNAVDQAATATFATPSAGRVTLTTGSAGPDDEPQVLEGTYDDNGMRFTLSDETTGQTVPITIDADGKVSGRATLSQQGLTGTLTVSGSLTPSRFVMRQQLVTSVPDFIGADVTFDGTK